MELILNDELLSPDKELFDPRFVGPKGASKDVVLYIVGEAAGKDEAEQGIPFVGAAGQTLDKAVMEAARTGAIDHTKIRYFNAVPYRPFSKENRSKDRTPDKSEIKKFSVFLLQDIEKVKPKIILLTGKSAMTALDIDMAVKEARLRTFSYKDIPVYVTYHPSWVLRESTFGILNQGATSESLEMLISDIKRAWSHKKEKSSKVVNFEVIDVLDWPRVEEIFKNDSEVVLDYEASGLNTYHHNYFIGGISLKGIQSQKYVYVMLYNFWRTPSEFTISNKLKAQIGVWLLSKKLIVFNMQYECAASLNYLGVYLRDVLDVVILNRCLGRTGGLKEIASIRLGVQTWNTEVDEWKELFERIVKILQPTPKGRIRDEVLFIRDNKCESIEDMIKYLDGISKVTDRVTECRDAFSKLDELIKKYYTGQKYTEFCKRFFDLIIQRSSNKDIESRFTDIPIEIIAPYAIADAEYTSRLRDDLEQEIKDRKIGRIAEVYNNLAKLGFEMESSGIAWDDELATKLDKLYSDLAVDSLRSLLMVPQFQAQLPSVSLSTKEKPVALIDCTQDILEVQTTTQLDNLTKYFNPRSNHKDTRERFSKLLLTGRVKFILMLGKIFSDYQSNKEECLKEYPVLGPTLEDIITEPNSKERFKAIDLLVESAPKIGKRIKEHPANDKKLWEGNNPPEAEIFIKYSEYKLEGLATEIIEEMYNAFWHVGGINIDDEETWIPEFRWLYSFRLYKKVMKSYSTYIWGDVGRGNVALINKKDIYDLNVPRYPGWKEKAPVDQLWIKETSFGVLTARTKRFKSGDHTVPTSELIGLRTSRFPDGVRLHWDLSQSEIRVLATIANDENLLQKFNEGADIHLYIASKIWGKPEKDISKPERRYAKSAVFAVLYGDSPPSFAAKFLNGNMQLAKYIFDQLFTMFPNIEKWIKGQHRFVLEKGYVLTPFGDPIYDVGMPVEALSLRQHDKELLLDNVFHRRVKLSPDREKDKRLRNMVSKAFRNAQNYPIQSTSSTLAGVGEYYLCEYIRDERMSARVDCFTHDSAELDIQITDLPKIISVLPTYVIDKVVNEFKIPIKTEYEIGVSGDQMVGLKKVTVDGPVILSQFHESKRTALDALERRLSQYNVKAEIVVDEEVDSMRSLGELFLARGAFALSLGKSDKLVTGKMKLDFSQVRREV